MSHTAEQIIEIIEEGIDNYDGEVQIEMLVAKSLIEHGLTVAGCEDDEYALSEYVHDGMPGMPMLNWIPLRELAAGIADHINNNDGGFIAVEV